MHWPTWKLWPYIVIPSNTIIHFWGNHKWMCLISYGRVKPLFKMNMLLLKAFLYKEDTQTCVLSHTTVYRDLKLSNLSLLIIFNKSNRILLLYIDTLVFKNLNMQIHTLDNNNNLSNQLIMASITLILILIRNNTII